MFIYIWKYLYNCTENNLLDIQSVRIFFWSDKNNSYFKHFPCYIRIKFLFILQKICFWLAPRSMVGPVQCYVHWELWGAAFAPHTSSGREGWGFNQRRVRGWPEPSDPPSLALCEPLPNARLPRWSVGRTLQGHPRQAVCLTGPDSPHYPLEALFWWGWLSTKGPSRTHILFQRAMFWVRWPWRSSSGVSSRKVWTRGLCWEALWALRGGREGWGRP